MTALGVVTASNTADAEALSDGDATVLTGAAVAVGNTSATELDQDAIGARARVGGRHPVGVVVNGGLADANTGENFATGNDSGDGCSGGGDDEGTGGCSTRLSQDAWLLSGNRDDDFQPPQTLHWNMFVAGPATAANSGSAFDPSDGSATIRTGDAQATGNESRTVFAQEADSDVPGLGGVIATQASVVANVGIAAANTGQNIADGNVSANDTDLDQMARGRLWATRARSTSTSSVLRHVQLRRGRQHVRRHRHGGHRERAGHRERLEHRAVPAPDGRRRGSRAHARHPGRRGRQRGGGHRQHRPEQRHRQRVGNVHGSTEDGRPNTRTRPR